MVVECPACKTRYRIDAGLVVAGETSFECCQEECGHIFVYTPPVLWRGKGQECEAQPLNPPSQSESTHENAQETDPQDESGFNDADSPDRRPGDEPPAGPAASTPAGPDGEAGAQRSAEHVPSAALLSVRNVLVLLGSFVCGYALLSYSALSHPGQTGRILSRLPVVGGLLAVEPFSTRHIRLDELSGGFWLSKDNRRVFAVAGTALNTARVSAKRVRVEGTLYNGVGEQVGRQSVFCGSEARAELLANLTVRDINTLQKFVPPQEFHIPAGRAAPCLLVFTRPPGSVAEISGRVLSVRFEDAQGGSLRRMSAEAGPS